MGGMVAVNQGTLGAEVDRRSVLSSGVFMNRLFRAVLVAVVALTVFATVGVGVGSAHTVSRTADRQTSSPTFGPPGHCQRRSISLRESSIAPMQMYGYQAFRFPDCATAVQAANLWGNLIVSDAWFKLYVWTGSGPYGGFSICRNVAQSFSPITSQVSNKFVNYSKAPCGPGMYAASICTRHETIIAGYLNSVFHSSSGGGVGDCEYAPYQQWLWTNDWHYFA